MLPWLELAAAVPQAWVLAGVAAPCCWLLGLARPLPAPLAGPERTIAVLVPAHNEAAVIGALVSDLTAQAYPAGRLTVLVIADGCTDGTAAIARRLGAEVLELPVATGTKGAALRAGWAWLLAQRPAIEAIAVLDADNRVEPDFVAAVDRALTLAPAIQGRRVSTAPAGEVGRLDHLSEWLNGEVEARGRAGLGLGVKIAGSAWAVRRELADAWGFASETQVEDLELTARLAARGIAVAFAPAVRARDEKVDDGAAFAGQRARWIRGRFAVGFGWGPRLLAAAPGRHRELGAYLLLPMRAMTLAGAAAFTALGVLGAPGVWPWPLWLALLALVPAQLVAGLRLAGAGPGEWQALWAAGRQAWRPLLAAFHAAFGARGWGHTRHHGQPDG